ncbi:hypothetical protein Vadar_010873 [Vaccinium darrowii]|nr:hypothetical protein Vadar_010873 [Vaccinium darrowii]
MKWQKKQRNPKVWNDPTKPLAAVLPSPSKKRRAKEKEIEDEEEEEEEEKDKDEKEEEEMEEEEQEEKEEEDEQEEEEQQEEQYGYHYKMTAKTKKSARSKQSAKSPTPIQKKTPYEKRKSDAMEGVSKTKGEKRKRPSPIQTPKGKKPKKSEKQNEEDVKEKEVKKQRKTKAVVEEEEAQEVNVKEGGVQYRGIEFSKLHKEEIRKSPFGNLLLCVIEKMMDESYVKKSDFETLKLVSRYQGHGGRFKLGSKTVKITEKEMTLIFGLQSGPNRIRLAPKPKKPNTKFADRICTKTDRIVTIGSLRECFEKVVKKNRPQDAKDVARVLTLYLLATVFCLHTTSRLNWNYLEFVEDLEASTSYAWSTYTTEYLIKELDTKEPKNVGGCVVGLLYWLCEHTTLVKQGAPSDFPRFNKWRLSDVTELLAKTPLQSFELENVIDSELVPTDEEQKLLQFVKVVKPELDDDKEAVKPADKEPSMEQEVENKERPTDAYSELQAEN